MTYLDGQSGSSLRVENLATLFWALGIIFVNTWPCPPAQHHSTAVHKACPYMVMLPGTSVRRWRVGSILNKDALTPPLFLTRMLFIYGCKYIELDEQRHIPTTKGEEGKRNHTWGKRVLLFYIIITLSWVFSNVYCMYSYICVGEHEKGKIKLLLI